MLHTNQTFDMVGNRISELECLRDHGATCRFVCLSASDLLVAGACDQLREFERLIRVCLEDFKTNDLSCS